MAKIVGNTATTSAPQALGTGVAGGFLNNAFGVPQRIEDGKFVLGQLPEFIPVSDTEASFQLKLQGIKNPKNSQVRRYQENAKREYEARRTASAAGGGPDGTSFFGDFGSGLRDFLQGDQLPGADFDALMGLISNEGNPVDVSAIADANFTGLKEQFSGFGGIFGSDFQAAQGRNVLELNVQAQESARQRQLQALGLFQTLNPFLGASAGTSAGVELGFIDKLSSLQSANLTTGGIETDTRGSTFKK